MNERKEPTLNESFGPWPVVILTSIVLGGAVYLSALTRFDWFSRSGALLIALLVVLYGLDRRKTGQLERDLEREVKQDLSEMGFSSIEEYPLAGSFTNRILPIVEKAERFRIAELSALFLATIVWGFGDLLVNKLIICGVWSC